MAHGCISSNGIMEVEDVGNGVLHQLVSRSLLQEDTSLVGNTNVMMHNVISDLAKLTLPDKFPGAQAFMMHDLVHDLAQSIMDNKLPGAQAEERSDRSAPNNNRIRHVDLGSRYVVFPSSIRNEADICFTLKSFNRMRMLNASRMDIDRLPPEIGELKHLRSLDLSFNKFRTLPNWVCRLWNLQILNLNSCEKLVDLPENMRILINLRHLFLIGCHSLSKMPSKIGELASLRTLSMFIVDPERGNHLEELRHLNLEGELRIQHLERVKNHMDAEKADLIGKPNLRHLVLQWGPSVVGQGASTPRENVDEEVLKALEPHPNLKALHVHGFEGRLLPDWMRHLTALERIGLRWCPKLVELPEGIKFLHSLICLNFSKVESMVRLPEVIQHVPQLRKLLLWNLPQLSSLPDWLGNITSLQALTIIGSPQLASLPASIRGMTNLQFLIIENCSPELERRCEKEKGEDWHNIAHIRYQSIGSNPFLLI